MSAIPVMTPDFNVDVTRFLCVVTPRSLNALTTIIPKAKAAIASIVKYPSIKPVKKGADAYFSRSEEHTSELQSRFDLVCRLLLEKKKRSHVLLMRYYHE